MLVLLSYNYWFIIAPRTAQNQKHKLKMVVSSENKELLGTNLYLKPTYAFLMPAMPKRKGPLSELQKLNMKHLRDNNQEGIMSKKSIRRLTNSVNWLVGSAKKKWVFDKSKNKYFSFKVNFVTLTLPSEFQHISDHRFKSVLLHNFINQCRYRYGLKNFIWKVEAQENGKIHAHFTTDTFLPWRGIRDVWNRILLKNGLMDMYQAKHSKMDFSDYCKAYNSDNKHSLKKMRARFEAGQSSNWTDPNSTDVHSVYKVKNIAAYMAKYMAKNEEDRRPIEGRLWSCSYSISQANNLHISFPFDADMKELEQLFSTDFDFMEVFTDVKAGMKPKKVGELFFFKLRDLTHKLSGYIGEVYRAALFHIRHGIDFASSNLLSGIASSEVVAGNKQSTSDKLFSNKQSSDVLSGNVERTTALKHPVGVQTYMFETAFNQDF